MIVLWYIINFISQAYSFKQKPIFSMNVQKPDLDKLDNVRSKLHRA